VNCKFSTYCGTINNLIRSKKKRRHNKKRSYMFMLMLNYQSNVAQLYEKETCISKLAVSE